MGPHLAAIDRILISAASWACLHGDKRLAVCMQHELEAVEGERDMADRVERMQQRQKIDDLLRRKARSGLPQS
jgi:hypothetical protein